jgi:hypothetical protein
MRHVASSSRQPATACASCSSHVHCCWLTTGAALRPLAAGTASSCATRTKVVLHKSASLSHSQGDAFCKATHGAGAGLAIGRPDVLATAAQLVRDAQVGGAWAAGLIHAGLDGGLDKFCKLGGIQLARPGKAAGRQSAAGVHNSCLSACNASHAVQPGAS